MGTEMSLLTYTPGFTPAKVVLGYLAHYSRLGLYVKNTLCQKYSYERVERPLQAVNVISEYLRPWLTYVNTKLCVPEGSRLGRYGGNGCDSPRK